MERLKDSTELNSLSFEELQHLKEELGTKVYSEAMFNKKKKPPSSLKAKKKSSKKMDLTADKGRKSRNSPLELPSKRPVREKKNQSSGKGWDPRFDDNCGTFNKEKFEKAYKFLDEIKEEEKKMLKKELKTEEDLGKKQKLRTLLQTYTNQDREKTKAEERAKRKRLENEKRMQLSNEGKKPFFLSKAACRYKELVERYEKLSKEGKLEKYMEKKRKQNASKERKRLHAAGFS